MSRIICVTYHIMKFYFVYILCIYDSWIFMLNQVLRQNTEMIWAKYGDIW